MNRLMTCFMGIGCCLAVLIALNLVAQADDLRDLDNRIKMVVRTYPSLAQKGCEDLQKHYDIIKPREDGLIVDVNIGWDKQRKILSARCAYEEVKLHREALNTALDKQAQVAAVHKAIDRWEELCREAFETGLVPMG